MKLSATHMADFANAIAHAFALKDGESEAQLLSFETPRSPKAVNALFARLRTALDTCRPSKHAPSIGEVMATLDPSRWRTGVTPKAHKRSGSPRALAELKELIAQGAYDRTKRAERGRLLAQLILLFDLESVLSIEWPVDQQPDEDDAETAIRHVRHALTKR